MSMTTIQHITKLNEMKLTLGSEYEETIDFAIQAIQNQVKREQELDDARVFAALASSYGNKRNGYI